MNNPDSKRLRIAIAGIRGVPACYGGFETFAEELGQRLVERGHQVTVYGREHVIKNPPEVYKGIKIKILPAPRHKYFETPVHTWRCLRDLKRSDVDVLLVCNAANSPLLFLANLKRIPLAVNVDGIERLRAKWNAIGRLWYRLGEFCSVLFANAIVADAEVIRDYYRRTYSAKSEVIAYGYRVSQEEASRQKLSADTNASWRQAELFKELEIKPDNYLLYVARLEPENNAHIVIEAYSKLPLTLRERYPLVVVGDAPYAEDYIAKLKKMAGSSVRFAGYRFAEAYEYLQLGALIYFQASEVGGTHPALVEAMGFANCIVANRTPEHEEVLADAGEYYDKNSISSLSERVAALLAQPGLIATLRKKAYERAQNRYSWELITSQYEKLFHTLSTSQPPGDLTDRNFSG